MEIKHIATLAEAKGGPTLDICETRPGHFLLTIVQRGDRLIYGAFASGPLAEEQGLTLARRYRMDPVHILLSEAI